MPSSSQAKPPREYTIDELAAKTGVPSRTIRFYQAKGVLPPPRKRGRVAVYDDTHAERLEIVGELQDKGLRLRAIRDVVCRKGLDGGALQQWLGIGARLGTLAQDVPELLTEEELRKRLGDPPPGVISRLIRKGSVQPQGEGAARRYLVESPALIALGKRLQDAGIDIDTAIAMHDILQRRLSRATRELVDFAIKRVGRGFGRSPSHEDLFATLEALFQDGIGAEAVHLIYSRELERAVQEALQVDPAARRGRRGRSHP